MVEGFPASCGPLALPSVSPLCPDSVLEGHGFPPPRPALWPILYFRCPGCARASKQSFHQSLLCHPGMVPWQARGFSVRELGARPT